MNSNNKYKFFNILLLVSVLAILVIYLFFISAPTYVANTNQITDAQKSQAVRTAYLKNNQNAVKNENRGYHARRTRAVKTSNGSELAQNHSVKVVINRKIEILDFKDENCDRNIIEGNFVVAKGSPSVLQENTTIKGNLYIINISSIYKLPKGLKVEGHIFVKKAKSVQVNEDLELNGNIYVYESGLLPVSQSAKIKGQIIL